MVKAFDYTLARKRVIFDRSSSLLKRLMRTIRGWYSRSYADAAKSLAVTLAANRSLETGQVEQVAESLEKRSQRFVDFAKQHAC